MILHFFTVVSAGTKIQATIVTLSWADISVAIFTLIFLEKQRDDFQGIEVFVIILLFIQIFLWILSSQSEGWEAPLTHGESKGITFSVSGSFSRYFKIKIFSVHGKIIGGDVYPFQKFSMGPGYFHNTYFRREPVPCRSKCKRNICLFSQCLFFPRLQEGLLET